MSLELALTVPAVIVGLCIALSAITIGANSNRIQITTVESAHRMAQGVSTDAALADLRAFHDLVVTTSRDGDSLCVHAVGAFDVFGLPGLHIPVNTESCDVVLP